MRDADQLLVRMRARDSLMSRWSLAILMDWPLERVTMAVATLIDEGLIEFGPDPVWHDEGRRVLMKAKPEEVGDVA